MSFMISAILLIASAAQTNAACNECHSKNPKMRKMHEALGYRDCFTCHGLGQLKKGEQQKLQMTTDTLCSSCHNK